MPNTPPRAIVLLSGGMDSAVCLAIAQSLGFESHALSFHYGQRHAAELDAAPEIAHVLKAAEHRLVDIDLRAFGGSALTGDIDVPVDRTPGEIGGDIPITYVPARNTVFLSYALAYAEVIDARDIYIGVNAIDFSGYPDCRPAYIAAFQAMARLGSRLTDLTIRAPLLHLTKAEIVARGVALGIDFGMTRSCYAPDAAGRACGHCDACIIRLQAFADHGTADRAPYAVA